MNRCRAVPPVLSASLLLVLLVSSGALPASDQNSGADYVGAMVCRSCHGPGGLDDAFTIWSVSKHSRTHVQLATGNIEMIEPAAKGFVSEGFGSSIAREAARLGVETNCLGCHTTASDVPESRRAPTFHLEDGVQCEACHGPGGNHVAWAEGAQGDATVDRPESAAMVVPGLDSCTERCHRAKPSHAPFLHPAEDVESLWRTIAHGRDAGR